jgi:hypothetical protein
MHGTLSHFDSVPEFLVQDSEFRHLPNEPLAGFVQPGNPPAGLRVLDEALSVPDQSADVQLVVQDPGAALPVPVDGRSPQARPPSATIPPAFSS